LASQRNPTLLAFVAEAFEVRLDGLAVLVRQAPGQVLDDPLPFFLGQGAPFLGNLLQTLVVNRASTAVVGDIAVLHRTTCISTRRTAGAAIRSATPVGSAAAAFLLVLQLLDQFVEAVDDVLLDLLGDGPAAGQLEPAAAVVHLAGDPVEVLLFP